MVVRGRFASWCENGASGKQNGRNFVGRSIKLCGRLGIYMRDAEGGEMTNRMTDLLSLRFGGPVGGPGYDKKRLGSNIGVGKDALEKLSAGGQVEMTIKRALESNEEMKRDLTVDAGWSGVGGKEFKPNGIGKETMAKAYQQARTDMEHDAGVLYKVWEWRRTDLNGDTDPWTTPGEWTYIEVEVRDTGEDMWGNMRKDAEQRLRLNTDEDAFVLNLATANGMWPFMVATDGGHKIDTDKKNDQGVWSSAAAVLLEAPRRTNEDWKEEMAQPALIRVAILPRKIGTGRTTNGHSELLGLCMAREMAPKGIPMIIITDSEVERGRAFEMRNGGTMTTRHKLRKTLGGTSKILATRLNQELRLTAEYNASENGEDGWMTRWPEYVEKYAEVTRELEEMIATSGWKESYWDQHTHTTMLKVDSHQLDDEMQPTGRYKKIILCNALVTANQLADRAASVGIGTDTLLATQITRPANMKYGPTVRFTITHGGRLVDQDTTKGVRGILSRELFARAATKVRQGLICRLLPYCGQSLRKLGSTGRLKRLAQGLAKTHTRELYKNHEYRNMIRVYRNQQPSFASDATKEMYIDKTQAFQDRYRGCPLCQTPQHEVIQDDEWRIGNREHLHLTCSDVNVQEARQATGDLVETATADLCRLISEYGGGSNFLREQITKLVQKRQEAEQESAESITEQCTGKSAPNWGGLSRVVTMPQGQQTGPTANRRQYSEMIGTAAIEPDEEFNGNAANLWATDVAFLGIVPDVTHEWILMVTKEIKSKVEADKRRGEAVPVDAGQKIKDAWLRVQAAMNARAEMMQLCIEARLGELQEEFETQYKESLDKVFREEKLDEGRPTRTAQQEATQQNAGTRRPNLFECKGPACEWKIMHGRAAARPAKVATAGVRCTTCSHTDKAIRGIQQVEEYLRDDETRDGLIRRFLDVEGSPARKQLKEMSDICYDIIQDNCKWEKPHTNRSRSQIVEYQRHGARFLGHTLLIQLAMSRGGPDRTPTETEREILMARAKTTCGGHPDQPGEETGLAITRDICPQCNHLMRRNAARARHAIDSRQCPCCEKERHKSEPASSHPCRVCMGLWLVTNNSLVQRLANDQPETPNDNENDETNRGMGNSLLDTSDIRTAAAATARRAARVPRRRMMDNPEEMQQRTREALVRRDITRLSQATAVRPEEAGGNGGAKHIPTSEEEKKADGS